MEVLGILKNYFIICIINYLIIQMFNETKIMIMRSFKDNLLDFFTELIIQFPNEPDLQIIKIFMSDVCSTEDIITYFAENLLKKDVKEMIDTKNDKFFLTNDTLFSKIKNQKKVFHFKKLYEQSNREQRDIIWQWFQKITKIAELYTMV